MSVKVYRDHQLLATHDGTYRVDPVTGDCRIMDHAGRPLASYAAGEFSAVGERIVCGGDPAIPCPICGP